MVSILDIEGQMNQGDNEILIRETALTSNTYRQGSAIAAYANNLNIYAQIREIYVDFFRKYWYKDNVDKTNEAMTDALKNADVLRPNYIWTGLTAEEHNPLGEYVLTLDFPIQDSEMKAFFKRVRCGDLEFLCRYPKNEITAHELLKGIIDSYEM